MSETRRALIVGNSDYQETSLRGLVSPARDTEELARVLKDPTIGGFDVSIVLNERAATVSQAIEEFFIFSDPRPDDLLLLYFSGHGITDEEGLLYLATTDTQLVRQRVRRSSAVTAEFIDSTMRRSRARRQILLLDCCHSGAFAEGMRIKGDPLPALDTHFKAVQGKGRVVLTASSPTQFAFEGSGRQDQPSVYTQVLVKGLETGEADLHGDGQIDIDELHEYVLEQIAAVAPHQTPTKSGYLEGQIYIARAKVVKAVELPRNLRNALSGSEAWMRQAAITELEALLRGDHPGLSLAARNALVDLRDNDDSLKVRAAAAKCLVGLEQEPKAQAAAAAAEVQPVPTPPAPPAAPAQPVPEPVKGEMPEPRPSPAPVVVIREEQPTAPAQRVPEPVKGEMPEPRPSPLTVVVTREEPPKAEPAQQAIATTGPGTMALLAMLVLGILERMLRVGAFFSRALVEEFHLSYSLFSSFTLPFIICFVLGSFLAGRAVASFGTRRVAGVGLLLSGVAALWASGANVLLSMQLSRALLGFGLSTVAPVFSAIFAQYELRRRALANGLYACVTQIATPMVASGISATFGWRFNSAVGGAAALIFAICWVIADRSARPARTGPSRGKMAFYCCVAYFAYSYCLGEMLRILLREQALFQWATGLSAVIAGVLLYRLIGSNTRAGLVLCKRFVVGGLLLAAVGGIAVLVSRGTGAEYLFGLAVGVGLGAASASLWTLVQSIGSPAVAAKWGGIQALSSSLAGAVSPSLITIPGCVIVLAAAAGFAVLFDVE
jgi:uncharacterized caspase-like protein/MFS family permease